MSRQAVLYITYDGLMEPLGQSQVLPYLRGLAGEYAITILSFEKPSDLDNQERRRAQGEKLEELGIGWIPLRYHKRPTVPATALDIAHGVVRGLGFALRRRPGIVHVRGYVPGVIGLALKEALGGRLIFDMRGFWPDEKVDAGAWQKESTVYRAAKWVERKLLENAEVVVSLTEAGVKEMKQFPYLRGRAVRYEMIPTCADLGLFQPREGRPREDQTRFVLGYVGSVGTFYLFDEVLKYFHQLLKERPEAKLLIVNKVGHSYIRERLDAMEIPSDKVELCAAEYPDVPALIHRMDAGVFFIKPTFSKKSSAPTRLGEFLGCGVPCLVNSGVGDVDSVVAKDQVGVVMKEFSPAARANAVRELLRVSAGSGIRARCVESARRHFSLERGVASYRAIYEDLLEKAPDYEIGEWHAKQPGVEHDGA